MIAKIDAALPASFPTSVRAGNTVARVTPPAIPTDTVDISDAARSRQLADADTRGQWEGALAMQRSGVPQLINAESAIKGGMDDMQNRMQQWLTGQGFDADTRFSLSYDAANKSFHVEGSPEVKAALETELNSATPSAAAMREGYAQLENLSSGLDSARKQFALDQAAGGHDIASRQQGFAYSFALSMQEGMLSANLTPLRVEDSVANSHRVGNHQYR